MTIAVTGATGQLGRLVLEELLSSQEPGSLVAVVRDAAKAGELAARGVQVRVADYSDPAALEAALAGVDKLLLVSGSEVGSRVAQHANVVNAAKAAGVGFIAYTSVLAADTTELILAPEHKATEELIRASGLDFTFLRNGWYTENYAQTVATAGRRAPSWPLPVTAGWPAPRGPTTRPRPRRCSAPPGTRAAPMNSPATTPGTSRNWRRRSPRSRAGKLCTSPSRHPNWLRS